MMTVLFSFFVVIYLMNLFIGLLNNAINTYHEYASYLAQKAEVREWPYYHVSIFIICGVNNMTIPIDIGRDRIILSFPKSTTIKMVFQYYVGNRFAVFIYMITYLTFPI